MNGIKCGNCKDHHESVAQVKTCYGQPTNGAQRRIRQDAIRTQLRSQRAVKADLAAKAEFAAREREQEEAGFASDPDYRDYLEAHAQAKLKVAVADGFYTVVMSDEPGDHVTIRIRTQDKDARFAPGEQIASYLMGPNNESDYAGFAFVKPNGDFNVWKRFKASHNLINALGVLTQDPEEAGQAFALESGRCRRCNRTLTVPASINRGFGPHCAGEVGL